MDHLYILLCIVITVWDARDRCECAPTRSFGTEIVVMRFSAEVKETESDSEFKGSGSLRVRGCNFAARDQGLVKSSLLYRIADNCAMIQA